MSSIFWLNTFILHLCLWIVFMYNFLLQHSIDYWLWADLIAPESERLLKNVMRVHKQEEADLFYIPFFTTISFFLMEKQQCKALYRVWVRSHGSSFISAMFACSRMHHFIKLDSTCSFRCLYEMDLEYVLLWIFSPDDFSAYYHVKVYVSFLLLWEPYGDL